MKEKLTNNEKINLYIDKEDFFLHYFPTSTAKNGYYEKITETLIKQFTKSFKYPIKTKILPQPVFCDHCYLKCLTMNNGYTEFHKKVTNKKIHASQIIFLIPTSNQATSLCKKCYESFKNDYDNCIEIYNEKIASKK